MRKLRQLFSKFNSESSIADEDEAIITFPMFEAGLCEQMDLMVASGIIL